MGNENDELKDAPGEEPKKEDSPRPMVCKECGANVVKSHRVEGDDEDEEYIPIAKCIGCGKEYDQYSQEYYEYYADMFLHDKDNTLFKLGLKGVLKGIEYEIIGRIRYQDEEEYEVETWDEWLAVSSDGVYHWFVEEDGRVYSYEEYMPESIDLESDSNNVLFEGKKISKEDKGYVARIVYAEGELSWKPEIGEPVTQYDFKKDGFDFTIEQSEDEVSITRGQHVSHKEIIEAFRKDEYLDEYTNTVKKRKAYKRKSFVYLLSMIASIVYIFYACGSGNYIKDVQGNKVSITVNEAKVEEGVRAYISQALFGPVELDKKDTLYGISVNVDETVQAFNLEWQSFRVMLIKEERLINAAGAAGLKNIQRLKSVFDEVDALAEPLESFVFSGDFWDEEGYDSDGYWHESDTSGGKDFVLDDPGKYFIYLETYSQKLRNIDSVKISLEKNLKSYRYFIIIIFVFAVLLAINYNKAKNYNELPFEMETE